MSDSDTEPNFSDLVTSVLFPGSDSIIEFVSYVRKEAKKTDWTQSFNRIEGIAVLLTIVPFTLLFGYFAYQSDWPAQVVQIIGLPTVAMLSLIVLLVHIYAFVFILRKVNSGESVLLSIIGFDRRNAQIVKFIMGAIFISASVAIVWELNMTMNQLAVLLVITLTLIGTFSAGMSCLIGAILSRLG